MNQELNPGQAIFHGQVAGGRAVIVMLPYSLLVSSKIEQPVGISIDKS
ncbi:MAG: hypothetical protein JW990_15765 [Thermoleophilia bacterium]|nr:hypothetical protein [Thermoleophilia bacterium]